MKNYYANIIIKCSVIICLLVINEVKSQTVSDIITSGGSGQSNVRSVVTDNDNNIYMYGHAMNKLVIQGYTFNSPFGSSTFAFVVKLDSNKNLVWYKMFKYSNTNVSADVRIAIDDDKNIYITDSYWNSIIIDTISFTASGGGYATYKLDSLGNCQWLINSGGRKIRYDASNYIEIIGFYTPNAILNGENITNKDATIVWLDLNGNYINHLQVDNISYDTEYISGRGKDSNYFGYRRKVDGVTTHTPLELFKIDSNGTYTHIKYIQDAKSTDNPAALECDMQNGGYYFISKLVDRIPLDASTGTTKSVLKLVKTDENFNVLSTLDMGPQNSLYGGTPSLNLNIIEGDVFVSGRVYNNSAMIWTSFGQPNYIFPENYKLLIGKFSSNLELKWYREIPEFYYASRLYSIMKFKNELMLYGQHLDFIMDGVVCDVHGTMSPFLLFIHDYDSTNINLKGSIFHDVNQDGLFTSVDLPLPQNNVVNNQFPGYHSYSNVNGKYNLVGVMGNQTIKSESLPHYWLRSTVDSINITINSPDTIINNIDFGMFPIPGIKDLSIDITSMGTPRPGFDVSYSLLFCNKGNDTTTGYFLVFQDTNLHYLSSTLIPDSIFDNKLLFIIPQMLPNECINIVITDSLAADVNLIGQNLSISAQAFPTIGDTVPSDNSDRLIQVITGGYDPNDISVEPFCDVSSSFIQNGQGFDYLIRFQNTGTDTAISITIRDTLPLELISSSFKFISSSHDVEISISGNELVLQFDSIMLPDSAANHIESKGYFKYNIKAIPTLNVGGVINNSAAIFFDFNPPIITNTVTTSIVDPSSLVSLTLNLPTCNNSYNGSIEYIPLCMPGDIVVRLDSGLYSLNSTQTIDSLTSGYYTLFLTNGIDTVVFDSVYVGTNIISTYQDVYICDGDSIHLAGSYQTEPGVYVDTLFGVTDAGCDSIIYTNLNVSFCTEIENINEHKVTFFYPNPVSNLLIISLNTSAVKDVFLNVFDLTGKLVLSKNIINNDNMIELDVSVLSNGIYIVELNFIDRVMERLKISINR
jgi:uncharacterized repeat protein (TIGR01451 family)